jgi:hypothetical protein
MISLLRFIGVANAGIWLGAAVFMTIFAGPAFFSADMLDALKHKYYAGQAAQIILERYFILHYLCAFIALAHLLMEWFYLGRRATRLTTGLWVAITALILFGGFYVQPKLHEMHQAMYFGATPTEQAEATQSFRAWHGASQAANLLVMLGLLSFFWRAVLPPPESPRYGGYGKYLG